MTIAVIAPTASRGLDRAAAVTAAAKGTWRRCGTGGRGVSVTWSSWAGPELARGAVAASGPATHGPVDEAADDEAADDGAADDDTDDEGPIDQDELAEEVADDDGMAVVDTDDTPADGESGDELQADPEETN